MKKLSMMIFAFVAFMAGGVYAEEAEEIASGETACVNCLSEDEQSFADTLSPRQQKLFLMMTREQRQAAVDAAEDIADSSDSAVEQVIKEEHLSILNKDAQAAR